MVPLMDEQTKEDVQLIDKNVEQNKRWFSAELYAAWQRVKEKLKELDE
jgi:hypothetical protein